MRVLTVHRAGLCTQDFCWGVQGEIAVPGPVICGGTGSRCACGCNRSHTGLNSHRASTLLMVREVDLDHDDLVEACEGYLDASGWASVLPQGEAGNLAVDLITDSIEIADCFEPGAVLRPAYDHVLDVWDYSKIF